MKILLFNKVELILVRYEMESQCFRRKLSQMETQIPYQYAYAEGVHEFLCYDH